MCGKEFDMWDTQAGFGIREKVGYGSEFDGSKIALDLCCDCFDKLIKYIIPKCKYSPVEEE